MSFEAVPTSEVYYMNLEYIRKPINIRFQKKNISLAGARTHENETRPEETCGNESLCEIEL